MLDAVSSELRVSESAHSRGGDPALAISSPSNDEWNGFIQGRVVQARTGFYVEHIHILATDPTGQELRMASDHYGWFLSSVKYPPGLMSLRAFDSVTGNLLAEKMHQHLANPGHQRGQSQVWPLEIGPVVIVGLLDTESAPESWKLRILERPLGQEQRAWDWIDACAATRPNEVWVRYPPSSAAHVSIERPWVEIRDASGIRGGESRLDGHALVYQGVVTLGPIRGSLRGRVLDSGGRPVLAAVSAGPVGPSFPESNRWPYAQTAQDGYYSLHGVPAGQAQVFVTSDHRRPTRRDVEIESGRDTWLDFELEALESVGDIQGELVVPEQPPGPWALLSLRSSDGGTARILQVKARKAQRTAFRFDAVPLGDYSLEVHALDGRSYDPSRRDVTVPSEGVVFESADAPVEELERLVQLSAHDRQDGTLLEPFTWALRIGPTWWPQVWQGAASEAFLAYPVVSKNMLAEVVVIAEGFRGVVKPLSEVQSTESGLVLDFALAPGQGMALIVVDAESALGGSRGWAGYDVLHGLEGARVRIAGRTLAVSDAHGVALVDSQEPVGDFEVVLPGWRVLDVHCFQREERLRDGLGFVMMVRD